MNAKGFSMDSNFKIILLSAVGCFIALMLVTNTSTAD